MILLNYWEVILSIKKIFSEIPNNEIWKRLLIYTYPTNIIRYWKKNNIHYSQEAIEIIAGSMSQSKEYFEASKNSSLNISPLLMYYGVTNLYTSMLGLKLGNVPIIENHGMHIDIVDKQSMIGDIEIFPKNPKTGALSIFCNFFDSQIPICNTGKWRIQELLATVPEILEDFISCYEDQEPKLIPLHIIKNKKATLFRIENSYLKIFHNPEETLNNVHKISDNYLEPQYTTKYVLLRPKMNSKGSGIYSLSGQKYLEITHQKNGRSIKLPIEISIYMILFALSYISRYKPGIWNPFVKYDRSGEKLLIENFLSACYRVIPNYILNTISEENFYFVNEMQGITDNSSLFSKDEIEEIVEQKIKKNKELERFKFSEY